MEGLWRERERQRNQTFVILSNATCSPEASKERRGKDLPISIFCTIKNVNWSEHSLFAKIDHPGDSSFSSPDLFQDSGSEFSGSPPVPTLSMIHFSSRLLILRSMHKISQSDLAKDIRVTRQTIAAIEMGTKTSSLYTAMNIAKYFESTVESVFQFKESRK